MLRSADLSDVGLSGTAERALGEILLREAPFLGSGTGTHDGDWEREVDEAIVRYWRAESVDEFLALRANELRQSPQLGWANGSLVWCHSYSVRRRGSPARRLARQLVQVGHGVRDSDGRLRRGH